MHWADREWVYEVFDNVHLDHWQRVNHFRNGREVRGFPVQSSATPVGADKCGVRCRLPVVP